MTGEPKEPSLLVMSDIVEDRLLANCTKTQSDINRCRFTDSRRSIRKSEVVVPDSQGGMPI